MLHYKRDQWEYFFDRYLATRRLSQNTINSYRFDIKSFLDWCEEYQCHPSALTYEDFQFFCHVKRQTLSAASVSRRESTLKGFYGWLARAGKIPADPLQTHTLSQPTKQIRETLTVDQIRRLLAVCTNPVDYALASLLSVHAMRTDDIACASVMDITTRAGHDVLMIRKRRGRADIGFIPIVPETASALYTHIGERKSGSLILNRNGTPLTRRTAMNAIQRLARAAELPEWVTPITLTFSIRAIAIKMGFTYASVVKCAGEIDTKAMPAWINYHDVSFYDHAVFQMADLVVDRTPTERLFHRAETLLLSAQNPPAISAALTGAALEEALRDFCMDNGVRIGEPSRAKLSSYGSCLKREGYIESSDVQLLTRIEDIRNDAAHGWFDKVTQENAHWILDHAREMWRRLQKREPSNAGRQ